MSGNPTMTAAADTAGVDLARARFFLDAGAMAETQAHALVAIGTLLAALVGDELGRGVGDEDQDQEPGADLPEWVNGDQAAAARMTAAAEFAERMRNAPRACIPGQAIHVEVLGEALCQCGATTI